MENYLDYTIRPLTLADEQFLWEMLYAAVHIPKGAVPYSREILKRPEISRYAEDWGQDDDMGVVAVDNIARQSIGAAWIRLLKRGNKGFGYVDDKTPELTVAVLPDYRGRGVGTGLLVHLLTEARTKYPAVSLSVSLDNPAVRLYRRLGFKAVAVSGDSLTMVISLKGQVFA